MRVRTFQLRRSRQKALSLLAVLLFVGAVAGVPPVPAPVWGSFLADNPPESVWRTVSYPDVSGDSRTDICWRAPNGVRCAVSNGVSAFGTPSLWAGSFSDANGWGLTPSAYSTIQFPNLGEPSGQFPFLPPRADVCGRNASGLYCAINTGSSFGQVTRWQAYLGDAVRWGQPDCYTTLKFVDINGDGLDDVCGRCSDGISCANNTGGGSFGALTLMTSGFNDKNAWYRPQFYTTIGFPDLDGDHKADVCGRGDSGIWCALNRFGRFTTPTLWTETVPGQYKDADGWKAEPYYSTIQYPDINGDGRCDVCGRGNGGFYCGLSTGTGFTGYQTVQATDFRDSYGWNSPNKYPTLRVVDMNGDGKADIAGRGNEGIYVAISLSTGTTVSFQNPTVQPAYWNPYIGYDFGDGLGYNADPSHWGTLKPATPQGRFTGGFCGKGPGGIHCSNLTTL